MSDLVFHWFLPTGGGDGRHITIGDTVNQDHATRPASIDYLGQVTRSAEQMGFEAALTPTGRACDDAWISTAMLSQVSERLKFLVAMRPGLVAPMLSAQMAATFQNKSGGRLHLNVVTGGDPREQQMYGDFLGKDERYARCDEFLEVVRRLWAGETVSFDGQYIQLQDASLSELPNFVPEIYFGGSSDAGMRVAAKHADVYLGFGERPDAVREKIDRVRKLAAGFGREDEIRFGLRLHSISRDTADEAWREADRLVAGISDEQLAMMRERFSQNESEGQRRMRSLQVGGTREDLEIYPNLWAGVGLVRIGAGTAAVGDHAEVADLIETYAEAGVTEFIMSGFPHLEETYWFGEGVLPELARRGRWRFPA